MNFPITVEEWDEVLLTGRACSPQHFFRNLKATVATVSTEGGPAIKVWPHDGYPDPDGTGKIWFLWQDIDAVEVIEKGSEI